MAMYFIWMGVTLTQHVPKMMVVNVVWWRTAQCLWICEHLPVVPTGQHFHPRTPACVCVFLYDTSHIQARQKSLHASHTVVKTSIAALSQALQYCITRNIISWHSCNCWLKKTNVLHWWMEKGQKKLCLSWSAALQMFKDNGYIFSNVCELYCSNPCPNPTSCKKRSQITCCNRDWKSSQSKTEPP